MAAMILMGTGTGLSVAPATESIMGSPPLHQAGVGSAVNDTSREVGGALGVAIVGSMLSSLYSANLDRALPATVPPQVRDAADQSVGAALHVSVQLGRVVVARPRRRWWRCAEGGAQPASATPTGQLTPVPPMPQYPPGFFARYCWW